MRGRTLEVSRRSEVDTDPPRPQNRQKLTRRMMEALLRIANMRGGVFPQTAKDPQYRIHPRTAYALHDAGLAVEYVVAIDWPDGTDERTPEIAITPWGRMVVDAFRQGKKQGAGIYY